MKIDRNVLSGLYPVHPADLHKPDLLHNIYLGFFKHMVKWIEGFLKKHKQPQAFDDIWKVLPSYPGFNVPKKAYREVTLWQGKEMRKPWPLYFSSICIRFARSGRLSTAAFQADITLPLLTD